jgi:hypothetical protein
MPPRRTRGRTSKRLTVTLDADEYDELKAIADKHRPPLTLRYVVEFALREFLARSADEELRKRLGDPRGGRS